MILTKYGIEMLGFSDFPETDVLEIQFGILLLYSIQGMNFNASSSECISEVVKYGENCSVVVSNSLNEACKRLTGEEFNEDEDEWIEKKKTTPPFVLIHFKEISKRTLRGGRRQQHEGCILTYDAFPEHREQIEKWEKESLPSVVTTLVVHLSTLEAPIDLALVERVVSGLTEDGVTVFDMKMSGNVSLNISSKRTSSDINRMLSLSEKTYKTFEHRTSQHFYAALIEKDKLKQFLSYFLFIERSTHSGFKKINYEKNVSSIFKVPRKLNESGHKFFKERFNESRNLAQRFHWCAILSWQNIDDNDVTDFFEIKKIRDKLAHGEDISERDLPIDKTRKLAAKIIGCV